MNGHCRHLKALAVCSVVSYSDYRGRGCQRGRDASSEVGVKKADAIVSTDFSAVFSIPV